MDILTIDIDFAFNKIMPIINSKAEQYKSFDKTMEQLDIELDRRIIFPTPCRKGYIESILEYNETNPNVFIIVNHDEILYYIDAENDFVTNIDFHDDGADLYKMDKGIVTCGNWAGFVKNYKWVNSTDRSLIKKYDMIFLCISPEWTPNIRFLFEEKTHQI
ncbi:MAG: hypothetical protein ACRDD8_05395 [Bacteroidales bacterium]